MFPRFTSCFLTVLPTSIFLEEKNMTLKVYHAYYRKLRGTEKRKEKVKITVILLPVDNYYEEFLVFSLPDCFLCLCVTHTHIHTPNQCKRSNFLPLLPLLSLSLLVYLCQEVESPPAYVTKPEPLESHLLFCLNTSI